MASNTHPTTCKVEMQINPKVHRAASLRAESQAQKLPDVARAILRHANRLAAEEDAVDVIAAPVRRVGQGESKRLRFAENRVTHKATKDNLRKLGLTITRVVEENLAHYARTGKIHVSITLPDGSTKA